MSRSLDDAYEPGDTTSYPLMIDGGTRIVYQFGHMTPDKGLKLYLDTIANPKGFMMDETLRRRLNASTLQHSNSSTP